jgi:hypothetical protein
MDSILIFGKQLFQCQKLLDSPCVGKRFPGIERGGQSGRRSSAFDVGLVGHISLCKCRWMYVECGVRFCLLDEGQVQVPFHKVDAAASWLPQRRSDRKEEVIDLKTT